MSRLVLAAVGCAALLTAHQPVLAGPEAPGPDGVGCGLVSFPDPRAGGGFVRSGVFFAGPIFGDGRVTCTVQVAAGQHSGRDEFSASVSGTGVVVMAPTLYSWVSVVPEDVPVYFCKQWTDSNGTVYWHPTEDPDGIPNTGDETPGQWTADPNKPCALATTADLRDPAFDPIFEIACPILRVLLPPEGDVPEIGWDCWPYGNAGPSRFHVISALPDG